MSLFNVNYQPDFHEEINEKNRSNPFVILVGWISCLPKHLQKYLEWYSQNNFDVIWYIPKDSYQYDSIYLILAIFLHLWNSKQKIYFN